MKLCLYACMCIMCMSDITEEIRRGIGSPGTKIAGGCETLCGFWERNLVLRKNNVYFYVLSHLSSTPTNIF